MSVRITILLLISAIYSCSPVDPKDMAKEYCDCLKEAQGTEIQDCQELAIRHKELLENDTDKQQKYADELVNCTNVSR